MEKKETQPDAARIPLFGDDSGGQLSFLKENKKPRPRALKGYTYSIETPLGKAFVTINENGGGQPFEVFINTAKAGSETAAHSEAIGRLISYNLRILSPVEPRERCASSWTNWAALAVVVLSVLELIVFGLCPMGYPRHSMNTCSGKRAAESAAQPIASAPLPLSPEQPVFHPIGELCPECGEHLDQRRRLPQVYTCGHSEC
jgi:ribonucleoside-diphosphate reductase alpha chain